MLINNQIQSHSYTTENSLCLILESICKSSNNCEFIGRQIRLDNNKRWAFDCGIIINDNKYLVEFDGFRHYQDALTIYRDYEKNKLAKDSGFIITRLPYWLQLTTETLQLLFLNNHIDFTINSSYPHGFIDIKALLPGSFCALGIQRFCKELKLLSDSVFTQVVASLYFQSDVRNIPIQYVFQNILEKDRINYENEIKYINHSVNCIYK